MCVIRANYLYDRDDDKACENEYKGKGRFDRLNSVTSFRFGWGSTQTQAVSGMKKITQASRPKPPFSIELRVTLNLQH